MKIQLLSAMYGRHKAVNIALESWRGEGLNPLMVVSNDLDTKFCIDNEIDYITHPNDPLSKKWQSGVDELRLNSHADAFLFLGSDDVIKGVSNYIKYLEQGYDFIGVGDVYIKELSTGRRKHWKGYTNERVGEPAGAGRCFSRALMDRLNWQLWGSSRRKGLDGELWAKITQIKPKCAIVSSKEIEITDLKDGDSLTPFSRFNLPIIE